MIPDNVEMIPVISSRIKAIGYDEETQELYVTTNDNKNWKYFSVTKVRKDQLMTGGESGSIGKDFQEIVKGYRYAKV